MFTIANPFLCLIESANEVLYQFFLLSYCILQLQTLCFILFSGFYLCWTSHFAHVLFLWFFLVVCFSSLIVHWISLRLLFWILCQEFCRSVSLRYVLEPCFVSLMVFCFPLGSSGFFNILVALCWWLHIWRSSHVFQPLQDLWAVGGGS